MAVTIIPPGGRAKAKSSAQRAKARSLVYRIGVETGLIDGTAYDGPYEITPSDETQTIQTTMKVMTQSFTVNPIPSNYGRIEWDGTSLLVY